MELYSFYISCVVIIVLVDVITCWNSYKSLWNWKEPPPKPFRQKGGEYFFGDCTHYDKRHKLLLHKHLDTLDLADKLIIREWVDIPDYPNCIIMRNVVEDPLLLPKTKFQFQICVIRIVYIHNQHIYYYYYYEWFLPIEMQESSWDIYFYFKKE